MIKIINPNRLTRQPFFQQLIDYLDQHENVILREIKREFAGVANIDRSIEDYIKAGYIKRENKRYYLTLPFVESLEDLQLDQEVFIRNDSPLYQELLELRFETQLSNRTNEAILLEETDFQRDELTLANYFYKMQRQYPLSDAQKPLYAVLGDVNPEYALKYMTTFLLKYVRKDELMQKRRDIFVDSLVILGYIRQNEAGKYELQTSFDKERLTFWLN
ncbi:hypothetical protein D8811_08145 [Streptococcus gordonii]|uniref:DUF1803 domain-containing protein n=1 Tax=Streptococcus gordonii TaxID=1302 RepID=UPI000779CEB7|nr:DUF1803 domain-containing protein [Streptococcus gordonii]MCY7134869.1 DUF1803 domain-containing protein [Streptococcus gordonii]RSJ55518.1 hypothetical protein D8811_08145 [Streptococcus gordonii]